MGATIMLRVIGAIMALGLAGVAGYLVSSQYPAKIRASTAEVATPAIAWVAAAPGRVEPRGGAVDVGTAIIGRVADVFVGLNDQVEEGQLLLKLDDSEARARLAAA